MIDAKRLAEIRDDADMIAQLSAISEVEILELVTAYEAARSFANWGRRWLNACNDDDDAVTSDELHAAKNRQLSLFPETPHD